MKKIIPAIGLVATVASSPVQASIIPADVSEKQCAGNDATAEAFTAGCSLVIDEMTKAAIGRFRVAQDFHDRRPPPGLATFGKAEPAPGSFIRFESLRQRKGKPAKHKKVSDVWTAFHLNKPV